MTDRGPGREPGDSIVGGSALRRDDPPLIVGRQYARAASLSVPETPQVHAVLPAAPHLRLVVDVEARQVAQARLEFEVSLILRATGEVAIPTEDIPRPASLYEVEVIYAGLFAVADSRRDDLDTLLLVEAPRLLFPSARALLYALIREGGFPAVNVQPVDFAALRRVGRFGA